MCFSLFIIFKYEINSYLCAIFFTKVNYLSNYTIPIKGLALGEHELTYSIDDKFFEQFDGSEIQKGNVDVKLHAQRSSSFIELDFNLKGSVWVKCDRCLDEYEQELEYKGSLFVKFSGIMQEDEGEVIYVDPNEGELNLAQYLYESVCLSLPLHKVHPKDADGNSTCNQEMLERLQALSMNFEEEQESEDSDDEDDDSGDEEMPWEEIEKLLGKKDKKK